MDLRQDADRIYSAAIEQALPDVAVRESLAGRDFGSGRVILISVGKAGWEVDLAAREVIEQAGYGKYFGHGLGHSLGLNIHENPRASRTYMGAFKMGNVITIEPGIYIPGKGGVRIEDMVYLAPEGKRNLTAFPK